MDPLLVSMGWLNHLLLCMWACTVSHLLPWLGQAFLSATGFWGRARGCVLRRANILESRQGVLLWY